MPKYIGASLQALGLRSDLTPDQLLGHINSPLAQSRLGGWSLRWPRITATGCANGSAVVFPRVGHGDACGVPLLLLVLHTPFLRRGRFSSSPSSACSSTPAQPIRARQRYPPAMRATAFAINIFVIHMLGDAISPAADWLISDHTPNKDMTRLHLRRLLILLQLLAGRASRAAIRSWPPRARQPPVRIDEVDEVKAGFISLFGV